MTGRTDRLQGSRPHVGMGSAALHREELHELLDGGRRSHGAQRLGRGPSDLW